jgi:hypothetical protein
MHPILTLKATEGQNNTFISEEISDRWYIISTAITENCLPGRIIPAKTAILMFYKEEPWVQEEEKLWEWM